MKTLCLIIMLGLSGVVALTIAEAQRLRPLTLAKIEALLKNGTDDEDIARAVRQRGLDSPPTTKQVEKLRRLRAGARTIEAVEDLLPKLSTPTPPSLPRPTPTPLPPVGRDFTETVNGVQLAMVRVPAGSFTMGAPFNEAHRDNEGPQHPENVPAFAIGKYEITQAQWRAVMRNNPSSFRTANFADANLPVENVSWSEAKEFCQKLSQLTGKTYRLPTEAEWEYACRAGTTGAYAGDLAAMAWYDNNSGSTTHLVGQKEANAFGLFDMHGNVWEWCDDVWYDDYKTSTKVFAKDLSRRALRGGSWNITGMNCRSAVRVKSDPGSRFNNAGFRVVVVPAADSSAVPLTGLEGNYDFKLMIANGGQNGPLTLVIKNDGGKLTTEVLNGGDLNVFDIKVDGDTVMLVASYQGNQTMLPGKRTADGMGGTWEFGAISGTWSATKTSDEKKIFGGQKQQDKEEKKASEEAQRIGDEWLEKMRNGVGPDPIIKSAKEHVLNYLLARSTQCELAGSPSDSLRPLRHSNQTYYTLISVRDKAYLLEMYSPGSALEVTVSDQTVDRQGAAKSALVTVSVPNSYTIYGIPRWLLLGSRTLFTIEMKYPWAQNFVPTINWTVPARDFFFDSQNLKPLSCRRVQEIVNSSSKK